MQINNPVSNNPNPDVESEDSHVLSIKDQNGSESEIEIYIHIPFCVKKCAYCDFLSFPCGEEERKLYLYALLSELSRKASDLENIRKKRVSSVFVGGGTPTVLEGDELALILECIRGNFNLAGDAEITLECNPKTADLNKLSICRNAGFNRLSIGLQSALDEELKTIGRIHSFEDFKHTYYAAVNAGFDNINVDIISALPGQQINDIEKTLDRVMDLSPRPQHISAYSLILEENTEFWRRHERGELSLPDEDTERDMHWLVVDRLEKEGYRLYEISNLSIPGYECRHNIGYWTGRDYIGIGIGAASLYCNKRFTNTRDIKKYIDYDWNDAGNCYGPELSEEIQLSENDQMEEFMFLGLRMTDGICKDGFEKKFGRKLTDVYGEVIEKNIADGLIAEKGNMIFLTRRGQDLANYVFSQFLF